MHHSMFYTLEEKIMAAWNVVDDMKLLCEQMLDGPRPMTEDEIANCLIGMEAIYRMRFEQLFAQYENMLREYHEEKDRKFFCEPPEL